MLPLDAGVQKQKFSATFTPRPCALSQAAHQQHVGLAGRSWDHGGSGIECFKTAVESCVASSAVSTVKSTRCGGRSLGRNSNHLAKALYVAPRPAPRPSYIAHSVGTRCPPNLLIRHELHMAFMCEAIHVGRRCGGQRRQASAEVVCQCLRQNGLSTRYIDLADIALENRAFKDEVIQGLLNMESEAMDAKQRLMDIISYADPMQLLSAIGRARGSYDNIATFRFMCACISMHWQIFPHI